MTKNMTEEPKDSILPCAECHRLTYLNNADKKPGLVKRRRSDGICASCTQRVRAGIPTPGNDYECVDCHTWVDTSYRQTGVQPSTGGRCSRCVRSQSVRKSRVVHHGANCAGGCGYILRKSRSKPQPGTRQHSKDGYCYVCYKVVAEKDLDERRAASEVEGHSAMMAARRRRKAQQQRAEVALAYEAARRWHYQKGA